MTLGRGNPQPMARALEEPWRIRVRTTKPKTLRVKRTQTLRGVKSLENLGLVRPHHLAPLGDHFVRPKPRTPKPKLAMCPRSKAPTTMATMKGDRPTPDLLARQPRSAAPLLVPFMLLDDTLLLPLALRLAANNPLLPLLNMPHDIADAQTPYHWTKVPLPPKLHMYRQRRPSATPPTSLYDRTRKSSWPTSINRPVTPTVKETHMRFSGP